MPWKPTAQSEGSANPARAATMATNASRHIRQIFVSIAPSNPDTSRRNGVLDMRIFQHHIVTLALAAGETQAFHQVVVFD
ncbi:hypothetical protein AAFJ72_18160 [Brevibacillus gelatini]|uniref:hypothetical protein n=1 Tax=Brevibacillus gelatini TaxID=1655277 RepID=UPI003D814582